MSPYIGQINTALQKCLHDDDDDDYFTEQKRNTAGKLYDTLQRLDLFLL